MMIGRRTVKRGCTLRCFETSAPWSVIASCWGR
jgi:hypothetical protein